MSNLVIEAREGALIVDPMPIAAESDVVLVRQAVRQCAKELGMSLVNQTKLVTAASELARNALVYGGGGMCRINSVEESGRVGLVLRFEDSGPGIADVGQALRDGYTTGKGLGLGLGGARRLVDGFRIDSHPGRGTVVTVTKWK